MWVNMCHLALKIECFRLHIKGRCDVRRHHSPHRPDADFRLELRFRVQVLQQEAPGPKLSRQQDLESLVDHVGRQVPQRVFYAQVHISAYAGKEGTNTLAARTNRILRRILSCSRSYSQKCRTKFPLAEETLCPLDEAVDAAHLGELGLGQALDSRRQELSPLLLHSLHVRLKEHEMEDLLFWLSLVSD